MLEHIDALIAFAGIIFLASLLVTVLTQIAIVTFNLRGRNLFWGITRLLQQIEPSLDEKGAEEISKKILTHPLISRYTKRLPPVIRKEEFSELLIKIVESEDIEKFNKNIQDSLKQLIKIDPKELAKQLKDLKVTVATNKLKEAQKEIFEHIKKARSKIVELESWFDSMTDRISERFSLRSKIITVIGAVIVTIVLQLDSIQVMKQVYTDSELRSKLIASTNLIMERGTYILGQRNVFDLSMDSLRSTIPGLPEPSIPFYNRVSAEKWLEQNLPETQDLDSLLESYRNIQKDITRKRLYYLGDQIVELNDDLANTRLEILGQNYTWELSQWEFPKFIGMLISIALLSLGAPFWFNILKNLTNLRTRLMQNEEKERLERGKKDVKA